MPKIYDNIEIGLTRAELRQALVKWMQAKTMITDYTISDVTLHTSGKYVVRFTVEPPVTKADQKALTQSLQNEPI